MQTNMLIFINLDWPAAGKLILGLVVWVAQGGLGSSVGVKELSSEPYHPADFESPSKDCFHHCSQVGRDPIARHLSLLL